MYYCDTGVIQVGDSVRLSKNLPNLMMLETFIEKLNSTSWLYKGIPDEFVSCSLVRSEIDLNKASEQAFGEASEQCLHYDREDVIVMLI